MFRDLPSDRRAIDFRHTIDPGFVNRRLVQTVIGKDGIQAVDALIASLPPLPGGLLEVRIDHVYADVLLHFCDLMKIATLGEVLATAAGHLFCSTEDLAPCPGVYTQDRVSTDVQPSGNSEHKVVLEFSSAHVRSDTLRMCLARGGRQSVIAHFDRKVGNTLYFHPLVIGGPWLVHADVSIEGWGMWHRFDFYEHFVQDFREFSRVIEIDRPTSCQPMKKVSENAFKACLVSLLGDDARKDWGGEMSDHFTASIHLNDKRTTAAFLLKGPAHFAPMGLNHLGKNNDQIHRLAQEPADVLCVQHCHDIGPAVRATLRAFTVQPGRTRRYCLIDGRDSLWLLQAYGLYDQAVEMSKRPRARTKSS